MRDISIVFKEEEIQKRVEQVAKEWKKEVIIPGFRKGKAPVPLIKSHLSGELRAEGLQKLIEEKMVSLMEDFEPFNYGPLQIKNSSETDKEVKLEVLLDVPPEINIDLSEIKLDKEDTGKLDIKGELKRLQEINSELRSVKRRIKSGDNVFMDIKGNDKSVSNYSIIVGDDEFPQKILNLKAGDEKEVESKFPEDFPIETLAGKKGKSIVKIVEVKKKVKPPLNDEFAKDLGFSNLSELKENLRKNLEEEMKEERKEKISEKVLEKALDLVDELTISPTLIEGQKQNGLKEEEAIKNAKKLILLDAIAINKKLKVGEKELDEWMEKIAESEDAEVEEMGEEAIRYIKQSILRNKALDYLIDNAKKEDSND